jgi:hypothetical protein
MVDPHLARVFCDVSSCMLTTVALLLPSTHQIFGSEKSGDGIVRLVIKVPKAMWPHKTNSAVLEIVEPSNGAHRTIRLVPA